MSQLKNCKAPGSDGVPNELLKILPDTFKQYLRHLFLCMWIMGHTPATWKTSTTILLHKRDDPTHLANKWPIGLHLTIYKLWTRVVTAILSEFAEMHFFHNASQEGFRRNHNTGRQLQRLVNRLWDAARYGRNIYVMYVDLTNALNTVSHAKLLQIMQDLGFPQDAIQVVRDLYTDTFSRILNKVTGLTNAPVRVGHGTIQGDTLSPLLFLIYFKPLLRWLSAGQRGYHPTCIPQHARPRCLQSALAFADDLALLTDSRDHMAVQFDKLMQ